MKKLAKLSKLKKVADKLWSEAIRKRDGKCLVCGATENLHAHHCIVRRAKSLGTRWNIANGIALCYICHMIKLHRDGDKDFLDVYMDRVNSVIPYDIQEEIRVKARQLWQPGRGDMDDLIESLTQYLKSIK